MSIPRRIREYRSTVILVVITVMSLTSLAKGSHASIVSRGLTTAVSVVSYPFLKAMTAVGNSVDYTLNLFLYYNATVRENEALHHQEASLLTHTIDRAEILSENRRLRSLLEFERTQSQLTLQPVEIVGGAFELDGALIVDRGSIHHIREGMCAMTQDGIVGRVTKVEPFVSTVATLLKADCKISAMIRRNRVRGMVHGSGSGVSTICTLEYIDIKEDVRVGDEVVTSPESQFPSGYPIGKVVAVHGGEDSDERALLKTAEITPAANPYRLDEVFVVLKDNSALDDSAVTPQANAAAPPTGGASDNKTIQERYAP